MKGNSQHRPKERGGPAATVGEGEDPEVTAGGGHDRLGMSGLSSLNYNCLMNVVVMSYPTCKYRAVARVVMVGGLGSVVHVQLCSLFGVLCERLLRLFIDQRRAQLWLEVERKAK